MTMSNVIRGGVGFIVALFVAGVWEYINTILVDNVANVIWNGMQVQNSIFPDTVGKLSTLSMITHSVSIIMVICGIIYFLWNVLEFEQQDTYMAK